MYKTTKLLIYTTGITGSKKKKMYYQSAKFIIKMNHHTSSALTLQMTISEKTALSISSYTDSPKLISQAG